MVYLSDTAGYIPVTSLRNRPTGINAGYHIDGDIDGWRHESWDRDYNHRNRFNNTRVQRECFQSDLYHFSLQIGCFLLTIMLTHMPMHILIYYKF